MRRWMHRCARCSPQPARRDAPGTTALNLLLLLPLGLAALAALLLPLLLHLARRSEPRTVDFAALRWLRARPQPQRRRRFEELLLLVLRLLLLALLALLLAQPVLFGRPDQRAYVAVAASVSPSDARTAVEAGDARWHWLAPGFPELDPAADAVPRSRTPASTGASLPSLLRELDATLPAGTPLTVLVPPLLDDADAQRPVLSRRVRWKVVGNARPAPPPMAVPARGADGFRLAVRHAPSRDTSLPYLRAAGAAWGVAAPSDASAPAPASNTGSAMPRVTVEAAAAPITRGTRALAWLAPGPVPQHVRSWVSQGGRVLLDVDAQWPGLALATAPVLWHDEQGALVRGLAQGRGQVMQLQRPLLPASVPLLLDAGFAQALRGLFADPAPAPARVAAPDYAPRTGAAPWPEQPRPLSPWLLWAIALVFLLERWLANGRRRSESA